MRKRIRWLPLLLALVICVSGLLQYAPNALAASFSNEKLQRLASYIDTYGVSSSQGKTLVVKNTSAYLNEYCIIRNQSDGLYFYLSNTTSDSAGMDSIVSFVLKETTSYISVSFVTKLYLYNQLTDQASTTKSITKSTYTDTATYSLSGGSTYISNSTLSSAFHTTLGMLFLYCDSYLYNRLGFGMKALGFTSYDGFDEVVCDHTYDNGCDTTCNNCGLTRTITHTYSGSCDNTCNVCGTTRTATGSHTYTNNKDASCNVCGHERIVIIEDTSATVASGTCGKQVNWKLTKNGTLVISGTGNMYGYDIDTMPWYDYRRNQIKKIQILPGVTSIGNYAFYACYKAEQVEIAETVTVLGDKCFRSCEMLREVILPDGIKTIPDFAFSDCSSMEYIYIPSTVKSFGMQCFYGCSSLVYFIIPDSVTTIRNGMFWHCTGLQYVQIPSSVSTIETFAFLDCGNLSDIYYSGSSSQYSWIEIEQLNQYNTGLLYATVHYNSKAPCVTCTFGSWVKKDSSVHQRACTNCGKTESASHKWNAGTITKQPTCAATGVKTYTCSVCGGTKTETIAKNSNHSYGSWTKVNDTTHQRACTLCGKTESANHSYDAGVVTKQPTCAATGVKTYTCKTCGGTKTETLAKTSNHTYAKGTKVDGDCHKHSCTTCGKVETVAHVWDAGKITVAPTLETTGLREHSCKDCDATKTVVVPKRANGDLNGDQNIDNKDVEYLLWHTLFPGSYPLELFADFNFDGNIDNKDVEYLLWHTLFPDTYPLQAK